MKCDTNTLKTLLCSTPDEVLKAQYLRQHYFFTPNNIQDPYHWTFNHEAHIHLILYQDAQVIGYTHIQLWPEKRAIIRIIVIDEKYRNKGAGSIFLTLCENYLKQLGIQLLQAESRLSSLGFYKKNGYIEMPINNPEDEPTDPNDIAIGKIIY